MWSVAALVGPGDVELGRVLLALLSQLIGGGELLRIHARRDGLLIEDNVVRVPRTQLGMLITAIALRGTDPEKFINKLRFAPRPQPVEGSLFK